MGDGSGRLSVRRLIDCRFFPSFAFGYPRRGGGLRSTRAVYTFDFLADAAFLTLRHLDFERFSSLWSILPPLLLKLAGCSTNLSRNALPYQ